MRILRVCVLTFIAAFTCATSAGVAAPQAAVELYTCSMHPDVVDAQPGKCPVCSMTLKARSMTTSEKEVVAFFAAYDSAFISKDVEKLAPFYSADTTVYEGGGVNRGWKDYRDNHLGPELKSYDSVQFSHSNVTPHLLGKENAFVTADYMIKTKTGEKAMDGGGLATYTLSKDSGAWKITHTHTSARRSAR